MSKLETPSMVAHTDISSTQKAKVWAGLGAEDQSYPLIYNKIHPGLDEILCKIKQKKKRKNSLGIRGEKQLILEAEKHMSEWQLCWPWGGNKREGWESIQMRMKSSREA